MKGSISCVEPNIWDFTKICFVHNADDSQICVSLSKPEITGQCLESLIILPKMKKLKLNPDKTEVRLVGKVQILIGIEPGRRDVTFFHR